MVSISMVFQPFLNTIIWNLHLRSSPDRVFTFLSTDSGRSAFWAEKTVQNNETIEFIFPNNLKIKGKIMAIEPNRLFSVEYFGGSIATFKIEQTQNGESDVTLIETNLQIEDKNENTPGWVSVLMSMKAMVDFNVDLRNHNPEQTWDQGYADN